MTWLSFIRGFARMCEVSRHLQPFLLKTWDMLVDGPQVWYEHANFLYILGNCTINQLLRCIVRHSTSLCAVWMAMGLLYRLNIMVKCVCYTGLWIHWFRDHGATIPNGSVTIGQTSLVGVGHPRSDSVVPLALHTVCYAMAESLAMNYRSLGTTPTLLIRGNISGRPCMKVMTYNTLAFSCIKIIR
jgi:hypothetical protein